jgi:hypothetical protein
MVIEMILLNPLSFSVERISVHATFTTIIGNKVVHFAMQSPWTFLQFPFIFLGTWHVQIFQVIPKPGHTLLLRLGLH